MRVLMIAPQPFFSPRGTPISVYQRLQGLSQLGHEVDLLTLPLGVDVAIPNVSIHRTVSLPFVRRVKIGPSAPKLVFNVLLFFRAIRMLLAKRYDVIHSHEETAFFAMVLGYLFGVPHIYDMHSSLPRQLQNFQFCNWRPFIDIVRLLEKSVIRSSSAVLTIGTDLEEHVMSIYPNANHILVENVAVGMTTPPHAEVLNAIRSRYEALDKPLIVYTGNFEQYQGLDLLLESIRIVLQRQPDVIVVLVGGTRQQAETYKAKAFSLGIDENVVFAGSVSPAEAQHYVFAADILVSPRMEGLSVPLKIYSYLWSGRATVVTDIYAHTQVLNDEISVITSPDPSAYAAGLLRLIEDPAFREQIGRQARAFAEAELSLESYLTKLEQAYLSIRLATPIRDLASRTAQSCARTVEAA